MVTISVLDAGQTFATGDSFDGVIREILVTSGKGKF